MGFTGEYFHKLDGKNRIRIPSKLRKELGDAGFCFAKGTYNTIFVFPRSEFDKIEDRLALIPMSDMAGQDAARKFNRSVIFPDEDAQGRIVLSPEYKKFAEINDEIVFIGVMNRIEIWSRENYMAHFGEEEDFNKLYGEMGL